MTRKKALSTGSHAHVLKLVAELSTTVALPDGVILRNDAEMTIWRQFTGARAMDGWRDFDLLIVAKAVRLEADIRAYQATLDAQGAIVQNDRGTQIVNPLLSVVDALQRQQLALIRSLSLTQSGQDPRTLNKGGTDKKKLSKAVGGFDDLIAR